MSLGNIGGGMPVGGNPFPVPGDRLIEKQWAIALVKERWEDPWIIEENLVPLSADQAAIPNTSAAKLLWRYGSIKDWWQTSFAKVDARKFRDLYVAIVVVNEVAPPFTVFCGVLPYEEEDIAGTRVIDGADTPSGDTIVTAYGLDYLLDRRTLSTAVVLPGEGHLGWAPPFNRRGPQGAQLLGNRSSGKTTRDVYAFGQGTDGGGDRPKIWSHKQILDYLLEYSRVNDENPSFKLSAEPRLLAFLDAASDVIEQEGASVWAIVKRIIDRRRGLCGRIRWSIDGDGLPDRTKGVELSLFTLIGEDVTVGDRTLPFNPRQARERLDVGIQTPDALVRLDETERYDRIEVEGQRTISAFSVSVDAWMQELAHAAIEPAWREGDQLAYDEAADDADRKRERFARVYTAFRLPLDWNWYTLGGHALNPTFKPDGTPDSFASGPHLNLGHRFLPWIPLASPADISMESDVIEPQWLRPFVVVEVIGYDGSPTGRWVMLHDPPEDPLGIDRKLPRATLDLSDRELTFFLRPEINHVLGLNHYAGETSLLDPTYDYERLAATMSVEADSRPRVIVDLPSGSRLPRRTLVLRVSECQTWMVAPGTIVGLKADGTWDRYSGPWASGIVGCVRDDSPRLREVAALAAAWYGRTRVAVEFTNLGLLGGLEPGIFVKSVFTGSGSEAVQSAVTSVAWDFKAGRTVTRTGFIELEARSAG